MKVGENALAEFLDALVVWEAEIVAILRTNRAMKRLSARRRWNMIKHRGATSAVTSS